MKRAVAFFFLLACSGVLLADSPDPRRLSREPASLLQDLVRLTNAGFSDETILVYAGAHRVELPSVVSADDLLWLRESGVSEPVIRYMTAIDVRASDEGTAEDVAYDSDEDAAYGTAASSYSDSYYGGYPDSHYDGYPDSYYEGYYPFYGDGYYPYPVYFFVNRSGFFGRFHRRGHGFERRRGGATGHGGFGHRFSRDFGGRRGGVVVGHRGSGRPDFPRGSFAPGFRRPRGGVIGRGGPGRPAFSRGGFPRGFTGPRPGTIGHGAFGHPGFSGGGHAGGGFGRGPTGHSGGGRGAIGRPRGSGRR